MDHSGTGDGLTGDSEMSHIDKCPRDRVNGEVCELAGQITCVT